VADRHPRAAVRGVGASDRRDGGARVKRLYVGVIVVEALVIAALWAFGRYFG
jgi:hypothetical protein